MKDFMKKNNESSELEKLHHENALLKEEAKSLTDKLNRSRKKCARQKQELKKKEKKHIVLNKEHLNLLSNRLPDINIQNLLSD